MAQKSGPSKRRDRASSEHTNNDREGWKPGKFALWSQRWGDPNDENQNYPTTVLLRHPTTPFTAVVDRINDGEMQRVAYRYLVEANKLTNIDPPLGIPSEWLNALNPDSGRNAKLVPLPWWLPIEWPGESPSDKYPGPFISFKVQRDSGATDLTVIMLASQHVGQQCLGSGFGIRVVAHAQRMTGTKYKIRITGMSACLPFGFFQASKMWSEDLSVASNARSFLNPLLRDETKNSMAQILGLKNDSIKIIGLRLGPSPDDDFAVEWRGVGKAAGQTNATPYSFVFRGTRNESVQGLVHKVELVADAAPGSAPVFPRDPASQRNAKDIQQRRPSRPDNELNQYRMTEQITAGQKIPLIYPSPPAGPEEVVVVCPRFVLHDSGIKSGTAKEVDLPGTRTDRPPIRSNDFAAISAYENVQQLFQRLEAYGLSAAAYFRIAKLPLDIYYKSGIRPGPGKDGQTINARVLVEGWDPSFEGPTDPTKRPGIEVHLALGNLSCRAREPWDGKHPSPAEPLGIAADARWIWHEIGHVLLMASVGELQFRFCHSVGDALAAIALDPQSELATNANWRGATYPWVFIPRRHDRCVSDGWSWGGTMHHALSQVPATQAPRRKGYWTEQILSSSLFRLYRCLGGDASVGLPGDPGQLARESASHYSVYLIMRAMQTLGSSLVVPANEPDQLISALIDADIGTGLWDVSFPPGSTTPSEFRRIGGCTHKVIRWAFEAQGMYTIAGRITDGPGLPPPVDIYIANGRPAVNISQGSVQYGLGSYFPVSLDWDSNQNESDQPPAWQATHQAIKVAGSDIFVTVGNRGTQPAINVVVLVWLHEWPEGGEPPAWDSTSGWTKCVPLPTKTIAAGASETFGPFAHTSPGTRYLVLAEATCADDRANTDPSTGLPCSQQPTPLLDLVANDNNLGLRVLGNF